MLTIIPVTLRREVVFIQMKSSGKHLRRMNGCSNLWWKLISQRWMTNAPLIVFVRWVSQKDTLGAKSRLLKSLAESQSSNLKSREQSFSKRICGSRLLLLSRTSKGSSLSLFHTNALFNFNNPRQPSATARKIPTTTHDHKWFGRIPKWPKHVSQVLDLWATESVSYSEPAKFCPGPLGHGQISYITLLYWYIDK